MYLRIAIFHIFFLSLYLLLVENIEKYNTQCVVLFSSQGLVKPYHFNILQEVVPSVESSLSRLVQMLLHQVLISQSRSLTVSIPNVSFPDECPIDKRRTLAMPHGIP